MSRPDQKPADVQNSFAPQETTEGQPAHTWAPEADMQGAEAGVLEDTMVQMDADLLTELSPNAGGEFAAAGCSC